MQEEKNISTKDFLAILARRKKALFIPFLLVFAIVAAIALLLPPVYKSTATILIEEQEIPQEYVMTTVTSYADQRLQVINQRIMSATRLQEIIDRFKLYSEYKDKKSREEITEMMREDIKMETVNVEIVDQRTGRPTSATIAFTLSYEGKNDPVTVQRVANVLTSFYLEENLKVREKQVTEASQFFEDELNKIKTVLEGLEKKISDFKELNVNALPDLLPVYTQNKHGADVAMERLTEQLRHLREREGQLMADLAGTQPKIDYGKQQLESLKVRLAELRSVYTDRYPEVKKLQETVTELEREEEKGEAAVPGAEDTPDNPAYISIASQLAGVQAEIASARAEYAHQEQEKIKLEERIAAIPANERQLTTLENERRNSQRKYDDLTAKFMEAKVAQGLEQEQKGERFTLIDPPVVPEKPYKPNRILLLLLGLVLGIGAGAGLTALREFSDEAVRNLDRLPQVIGVPLLAVIPEIVTPSEVRSRKRRKVAAVLCCTVFIVTAGFAFQYLVMDYQILWIKLMRRLAL